MEGFTRLEEAVLAAMYRGQGSVEAALHTLATARVTERENTGHEFYTKFDVDRKTRSRRGRAADRQDSDMTLR
jgi:hypothetical protein